MWPRPGAAVGLADVDMADIALGRAHRAAQSILLDVHVEGVQQELYAVGADLFGELHALGGGVDEKLLEPVDHLKAVGHALVRRGLRHLADAGHAAVPVGTLVAPGKLTGGPAAVDDAAEDFSVHLADHLQQLPGVVHASSAHGRVGAGHVVLGGKADAVRQLHAGVL